MTISVSGWVSSPGIIYKLRSALLRPEANRAMDHELPALRPPASAAIHHDAGPKNGDFLVVIACFTVRGSDLKKKKFTI